MPAAWVWVLVYILAFCLFQVLLYRYLQREDTTFEQTTPEFGEGEAQSLQPKSAAGADAGPDGVQCPHCGTPNESDPMYSYCRACAEPLDSVR